MADTEILNRAEKYIKGKGKTLNKYDLVGFANAETDFLSKHILELQADKGKLTDELTKAKKIIKTLLSSKTDFDEKRFALWAWKEEVNEAEQFLSEVEK